MISVMIRPLKYSVVVNPPNIISSVKAVPALVDDKYKVTIYVNDNLRAGHLIANKSCDIRRLLDAIEGEVIEKAPRYIRSEKHV